MILLWQAVLEQLRDGRITSEPWTRDRRRVRQTLLELYVLGERPTLDEIRRHGGVDGRPTHWSREVARLWAERIRWPTRTPKKPMEWRHLFLVPHLVVQERSLPSVESRLASEIARLAHEIADAITEASPAFERDLLNEQLRLAARALRRWSYTCLVLAENPKADVVLTLRAPRRPIDF